VNDQEHAAKIEALLLKVSRATARKAALISEIKEFEAKLGEIRAAFGNPYFYSGVKSARPETAGATVANYTGYKAHEPGLRIARDFLEINRELTALTEQLRALGVTTS
jgi:hypothetical protein